MRAFVTRYRLRTGETGSLHVLAHSSVSAVLAVMDAFGDQLAFCSARVAS